MGARWQRGREEAVKTMREGMPRLRTNLMMIAVFCGVVMAVGLVLMALGI